MKWPQKSLVELAANETNSFVDGPFGSNLKASEYQASGVPIVRLQNVRPNLFLHKDIKFISERKAASLKRHDFRTGDLVIAKLGDPCAVACLVPDGFPDGRLVADVVRFRGKPSVVDHRYVAYFLNSPAAKAQVEAGTTGTTRKRVNLTRLKAIVLPLPPLAEQRRIAEVLDRADALRAKRRAALAQLESLTQSLFLDLFGDPIPNERNWPVSPIVELEIHIADGNYSSKYPTRSEFVEMGVPFIRANNLRDLTVVGDDLRFISPAKHKELQKGHLIEGDVLITTRGEIGNIAVVPRDFQDANINAQIVLLRPNRSHLEPKYLAYLLNLPQMKIRLQSYQNGVALKQLPIRQLVRVPVPIPPISLQREFARRIAAVEKLKATHRASLAELDALFTSLQHRAFRGEL